MINHPEKKVMWTNDLRRLADSSWMRVAEGQVEEAYVHQKNCYSLMMTTSRI